MSNYKVELERTEKQDLEIKKHISDVKAIIKSKVNKDVNGLKSIKELLENETLGGYIVDDLIKIEVLAKYRNKNLAKLTNLQLREESETKWQF